MAQSTMTTRITDAAGVNRAKVGAAGDQAVSITHPSGAAAGLYASITAFGSLSVTGDGVPLLTETFEGATLDTVHRWTVDGTAPPTQTQGLLTFNPATTASATSVLVSQPTFLQATAMIFVATIALESGSLVTGNHRFFGLGTAPVAPGTAAAPLQDAVGFEIDTTGALRASVYNAGSRVFSTTLTAPTDGARHSYFVMLRGDLAFFYRDTLAAPLASSVAGPASQTLPIRIASLNATTALGTAATMNVGATGVIDDARVATGVSDGTFLWRRAGVTDVTTIPNSGRLAAREQWFGSALNVNTNAIQLATYTFICKPSAAALTANTLSLRCSLHHLATATKTVRIRRVKVSGLMSAIAESAQIEIHRLSAAPTGTAVTGAAATASLTALDTRDPAPEVTALNSLTAATSAGLLVVQNLVSNTSAVIHGGGTVVYDWQESGQLKALTLRAGVLEGLAVGILSNAAVTPTLTVEIIFTEE